MELSKSLLKFSAVAYSRAPFCTNLEHFFNYARFDVNAGIIASLELVAMGATIVLALLLIAAIDVHQKLFEKTQNDQKRSPR